ncbi:hypothetical protein BDV38DRAFT_161884 [Aspergillus pseudotamarii]|uniref:Uncharacterized protein n=1 Tax=Aspergillus pseudotamarii TaxID=132259 RepID=A0A5N6SIS3_ASPPS|nr:uncharacterized protein BDV38DRAFT_161884 [Aspergillus pseudotamarii]KAE8134545.1 hypothetical protein BDV38DRAFT_161884 [Aspergillus pseudotamarii]
MSTLSLILYGSTSTKHYMASTASSEFRMRHIFTAYLTNSFEPPSLIIPRLFHERLVYSLIICLSDLSGFSFLILLLFTRFLYSFPALCLPEIPGEILLSHVYRIWHGHHVWRFKESTKEGRLFSFSFFFFFPLLFFFTIFFSLSCLDPIVVWLQSCYISPCFVT